MRKPKLALVRGCFLNQYETQNFRFKRIDVTGFSSSKPHNEVDFFPVIKLPSLCDLQNISFLNRPIKFLANRVLGDSQFLLGLEKFAGKFDLWHSADPHYFYTYQLAKLRAKNKIKKLIITSWETIPFNNQGTRAKKKIKTFSLKKADFFLTYTQRAKKALVQEGVIDSKIKTINLGVDLDRFKPGLKRNDKEINLLFVGRLVEEKGVLDLYSAYKHIIKTWSGKLKIKLLIVGRGPLKKTLQKKINNDGFKNLVTVQEKNYQAIPLVYQQADIFIGPSKATSTWEEQYGMVFIEAMASGLPIVSYRTGAIPEVLGKAGILIEENNLIGLTKIIINLIRDQELRKKLGKISRERAERFFDAEKQAQKFEAFYFQCLK